MGPQLHKSLPRAARHDHPGAPPYAPSGLAASAIDVAVGALPKLSSSQATDVRVLLEQRTSSRCSSIRNIKMLAWIAQFSYRPCAFEGRLSCCQRAMPETLRAPFDHRGPSSRLPRAFVALFAFLACMGWPGPRGLAQGGADSSSSQAELAGDSNGAALTHSSRQPDRYQQNSVAQPVQELRAVESDTSEEDAGTEACVLCGGVSPRPILLLSKETSRVAYPSFSTQFLTSTALPRGPPHSVR